MRSKYHSSVGTVARLGSISWEAQRYTTLVILDRPNALNCHLLENSVSVAQTNHVLRSKLVTDARQVLNIQTARIIFYQSTVVFSLRPLTFYHGVQPSSPRHVMRDT